MIRRLHLLFPLAITAVCLSCSAPAPVCPPAPLCPPAPVCPPAAPTAAKEPAPAAGTLGAGPLMPGPLSVNPEAGRNTFTAVFDSQVGERITAQSSAVACDVTYDDKMNTFSGKCSVPLTSITVDNDSTKAEHFQQWSTNKKSDPKDCKFEATFTDVKVSPAFNATEPSHFTADVPFTICGRARADGGKEHVEGSALLEPADKDAAPGDPQTVRLRATVDGFSREKYQIGPAFTEGWLARVQKLANVVADKGTITLSLFAVTKAAPPAPPAKDAPKKK